MNTVVVTYILMKTKDPKVGMLYEMLRRGQEVLSRTSLSIKIPYAKWDKDNKSVKASHPDADRINQVIDKSRRKFRISQGECIITSDKDCFLEFMDTEIGLLENQQTILKYQTVRKNLMNVLSDDFHLKSLPIDHFRDRQFVDALRNSLRKSQKIPGEFKSNRVLKDYCNIIKSFVDKWNIKSGTSNPINLFYFAKSISKSPKKKAEFLSHEELYKIINYQPNETKPRCLIPLLRAKNTFIFQYYTGGIRFMDAVLLTNKQFNSNGVEINIRKTGEVRLFDYIYPMVNCLQDNYPKELRSSVEKFKVKDLSFDYHQLRDICRLEEFNQIMEMSLPELKEVINRLEQSASVCLLDTFDTLKIIMKELQTLVMNHFFELIRLLPPHFVFSYLKYDDFKEQIESFSKLTRRQVIQITNARKIHNESCKKIAEKLNIRKLGGKVPRTTLANHMNMIGLPLDHIQNTLAHSSITTTQIYVRDRLDNPTTKKALKLIYEGLDRHSYDGV